MANTFTEIVWDIISDDEELLATLEAIMRCDYEPFFPNDKAVKVNTLKLQEYMLGEMQKWYEWLPDLAMHLIGGELAMKALELVDFQEIAELVLTGLEGSPGQGALDKKSTDKKHLLNGHSQ